MTAAALPTAGAFLGAFAGVLAARLASAWLVRRAFKLAHQAMVGGRNHGPPGGLQGGAL